MNPSVNAPRWVGSILSGIRSGNSEYHGASLRFLFRTDVFISPAARETGFGRLIDNSLPKNCPQLEPTD